MKNNEANVFERVATLSRAARLTVWIPCKSMPRPRTCHQHGCRYGVTYGVTGSNCQTRQCVYFVIKQALDQALPRVTNSMRSFHKLVAGRGPMMWTAPRTNHGTDIVGHHREKKPAGRASLPDALCHRRVTSHLACVFDSSGAVVANHLKEKLKQSRKACHIKYSKDPPVIKKPESRGLQVHWARAAVIFCHLPGRDSLC